MNTRLFLIIILSVIPGVLQALGLGPITPQSYLGQPFSARIDILSASVPEMDSLIVVRGDAEAFQRAGLELTHELKKIQLKLVSTETGEHYIQVTSEDPVLEPVLSFVVEAIWRSGQMTRIYTVLLDPPFYAAAERSRAQALKKATVLPETPPPAVVTREPPQISLGPPATPAVSVPGMRDWTVSSGDTLWFIANKTRPDSSISVDQMMLAILQANPAAFINNNINNIKLGSTLRLPEVEEIRAINKQEAGAEVRIQNAEWRNRQLAGAEAPGIVTSDSGQPGLRILAPDTSAESLRMDTEDSTPGQNLSTIKQELALTAESIESYRSENAALEARLTAAEATINELKAELRKGLEVEAPLPVRSRPASGQYGPTVTGDNLWTIANRIRPDISISTNQMMVALLRANPDAFINANINLLRSGVILQVPATQDILTISKAEAAAEVQSHYTSWKSRR